MKNILERNYKWLIWIPILGLIITYVALNYEIDALGHLSYNVNVFHGASHGFISMIAAWMIFLT